MASEAPAASFSKLRISHSIIFRFVKFLCFLLNLTAENSHVGRHLNQTVTLLSRLPFLLSSISAFESCEKNPRASNRGMSLPGNLDEKFQIKDAGFQRSRASHGIHSAEEVVVHDPSLLDASIEDEDKPGASHKGTPRVPSFVEIQYPRWINGVELLEDVLRNKRFLPTGCEGIDTLLGGGLKEGQLTEIVGHSPSGKTQICLCVASHVAFRNFGSIIFFDTSNSFSPSRVASIVNQFCRHLDKKVQEARIKMIMRNIHCQSVFDIFALLDALEDLECTLKKQTVRNGKICMLIVDSVSSLITPILGSKDPEGRSLMVSAGYLMKKLADEWNLSVLVTNHMVGGGGTSKPALGESWKCIPHVRLMMSRDHGSSICNVSILRHTSMAYGRSAEFVIPN